MRKRGSLEYDTFTIAGQKVGSGSVMGHKVVNHTPIDTDSSVPLIQDEFGRGLR